LAGKRSPVSAALWSDMAGYSGTPLPKKLGIKDGHRVVLVNPPARFVDDLLVPLPGGVLIASDAPIDGANVVVFFVKSRALFESKVHEFAAEMDLDGGIWIGWPKKASKVPTEMTEDVIRAVALPTGLVDNKVCAIDATWSGLRLVWRKEVRKERRAAAKGKETNR